MFIVVRGGLRQALTAVDPKHDPLFYLLLATAAASAFFAVYMLA
jgi:hypothetical protein